MDIKYIYGNNNIANAYIEENGKKFRIRVEMLIVKDDKVLLNVTNKEDQYGRIYKIPGGSVEPDLTIEESVKKECKEEVRINVKDVQYCCKIKMIYKSIPEWHKKVLWPIGLNYVGTMILVFTGNYSGKYNGYIKEEDRDPNMLKNSKFYNINDIKDILSKEHRKALKIE